MYNPFPTLLTTEAAVLMIAVAGVIQGFAILIAYRNHRKLVNTVDMMTSVVIDLQMKKARKPRKKK